MAGVIPTATGLAQVKALWEKMYIPFTKDLEGVPGIALADVAAIALLVPSTVTQEVYAALSGGPALSERVGELIVSALLAGKLELLAKDYEAALGIKKNDFRDDRLGLYNGAIQDMAAKATWQPMQLVAAALAANPTAVDGTALFADARDGGIIATIDNDLAPTMAGTVPTVLEMQTAVQAAISALKGYHDASGHPYSLGAKFEVEHPTALAWQCKALAENETLWSGSAAAINEVRGQFVPRENPFLSSGVTFYTYVANSGAKPLLIQERQPLETESLGEGSDEWVKRDRAIFKVSTRRVVAAGHPALITRSVVTHA
jgi:phage major head subunit gpT-like protein